MNLYLFGAKLLAGLALVAAVLWGVHLATEHFREQGRMQVRAEWDKDKAARMALTTGITLAWNDQRIAAETAGKERDDALSKRIAVSTKRAASLPAAVAAVVVPADALRVLDDAIRDSPAVAGAAGGPVATAPAVAAPATYDARDGTIGELTQWGVTVVGMYELCRERVAGWQSFYAGLIAAQPKEATNAP